MIPDPDACYELLKARDTRYDGVFYVGVSSTGVYCRPICAVRTPRVENCSFYAHPAAAEQAGYRPCLKCRPELAPGHAPVDAMQRVARQAAARIAAGALNEASLDDLAAGFDLSARQLRRAVEREFGVPPLALAQTHRLLLAKQLLTETELKVVDVAFASGFGSLRRFNDAFRRHYRLNPSAMRRQRRNAGEADVIRLRMSYRAPYDWIALARFLAARGHPRLERLEGPRYLRTVRLGPHVGWVAVSPVAGRAQLDLALSPSLLPVLTRLLAQLRRLFDLDAHPGVIAAHLSQDTLLQPRVTQAPGLRVPGALEPFELVLRAILGQQISVKAATTVYGRFVERFGHAIETPEPVLDRLAPTADDLANLPVQALIDCGLPRTRATTIAAVSRAFADGSILLVPGSPSKQVIEQLQDLPGIGPWTAQYVAMRALSDPDAFPDADLVLMQAAGAQKPSALRARAEAWRPWRAYAAMQLWHGVSSSGNSGG